MPKTERELRQDIVDIGRYVWQKGWIAAWGGAITASMFLKEFVESTPWVHLDIAGTAWLEEAKPFLGKGPSGVPVRSLTRLAMDWAGK